MSALNVRLKNKEWWLEAAATAVKENDHTFGASFDRVVPQKQAFHSFKCWQMSF